MFQCLIQVESMGWVKPLRLSRLLSLYPHNEVVGGYIGFRPSVPHPVSALQRLQFWLDPFHIYTFYQATSEGVSRVKFLAKFQNLNFWQFFKICSFDFVLFWLGVWCESLVWVIMGRRGVSQNAGVLVVLACAGMPGSGFNINNLFHSWEFPL